MYGLDEPTSRLRFSDIQNLLSLLAGLADEGHTILATKNKFQRVLVFSLSFLFIFLGTVQFLTQFEKAFCNLS